jgi:acetylglutamate/LysW-gamma-L-alpha-aminoadipate kinase
LRIVAKIGGSLIKHGVPPSIIEDIRALSQSHQLIVVHGGGEVVTEYANRLGKEQRFVVSPDGVRSRYTDMETAEIYQMVMSGLIAKRLVSALAKAGVRGISLSGTDAYLIRGKRKTRLVVLDGRGRRVAIDGGYTGRVTGINSALLEWLLTQGYVPVVSPVALGEGAEPLNIDGDRAASSLAAGTSADAVVFLTNVDGLNLEGGLVGRMTTPAASSKLPAIGFGMQRKVMGAIDAVEGGVKEAIICSGLRNAPLTSALSHDSCTVISNQ